MGLRTPAPNAMQRFVLRVLSVIGVSMIVTLNSTLSWSQSLDNLRTRSFFTQQPETLHLEAEAGSPPATRVVKDGKLMGYIFSTYEVSGSLGFSGKPIDIHVGLTPDGLIAGAYIVRHQEPILILGIPSRALEDFVAGFVGFDIRTKLEAGKPLAGLPDAVSGASVSSGVIRDAIIRSARNVAFGHDLFGPSTGAAKIDRTGFVQKNWQTLLDDKSVAHRTLTLGEVDAAFGDPPGDNPEGTFIDLYTALLTPPTIGRNLLKRLTYNDLIGKTGVDDHLILIAANGLSSFRGRAWKKSGVFDRIEITQGPQIFRLSKTGYHLIPYLYAAGAPEFREIAVFTIPESAGFRPEQPWQLRLLVTRDQDQAVQKLQLFDLNYKLPAEYVTGQPQSAATPVTDVAPALWMEFWFSQKLNIAVLLVMLFVLTGILFFQDALARRKSLYLKVRGIFLMTTLLFLGLYAGAQLSVINVVTFVHSLMGGFRWELFLLNPLVFILWGFVAVALLFWGRGVYCGWLCPFGALQELINLFARRLKIKQIAVPWGLHERLWPIKYVAFLSILAISLSSMTWAFWLAEIEPFKTAIILKFVRDWPFVVFAVSLLVAGLFIERFYCRYLCPLGAALAIPARLRMFEWLKRRHQCGRECRICATNCTVQAIHPMGQINPNECIYCLRCQVNYYDDTTCRPLVDRARRRARQSAPTTKPGVAVNAE